MRAARAVEIATVALVLLLTPVLAPPPRPATIPFWSGVAYAVQPDEVLPDPALEARARAISGGLRCLVCQNQSIDDSDAGLARDLRLLVRERLSAGDSDGAVVDYLVARYGEFVLLRPRLSAETVLLWGTPVLLLLAGGGYALARAAAARRRSPPLTPDEESAVEAALRQRGL